MSLLEENYSPVLKYGGLQSENDLTVTYGSVVIGDSDGSGSNLDASGDGKILVGNATTATSVAVSGDVSLTNAGVTAVNSITTGLFAATTYTAAGAIAATVSCALIDSSGTARALTIAAPAAGRFLVISQVDTGTDGHTVVLTAGTYDGTNDTATFNAGGESLVLVGVSATRFLIVENLGSVALSAS